MPSGRKPCQKASSLPDRPIDRKVFVTIDPQDRPNCHRGLVFAGDLPLNNPSDRRIPGLGSIALQNFPLP